MPERTNNKVEQLLSEILRWIRFIGAKDVKEVLGNALDSEQKILIYHLSDGTRGSVEIGKLASTSDRTVRRNWSLWYSIGIVEPVKVRGGDRFVKVFNVEDFGIAVPQSIKAETEGILGETND